MLATERLIAIDKGTNMSAFYFYKSVILDYVSNYLQCPLDN